jgi:predicted nucleic acid-binding protein
VKLLVDTCVWSLLLRRRAGSAISTGENSTLVSLREAVKDGRAAILGAIRQELLSGVRDELQFERLRSELAAFPDERVTTFDFEEAARLFNICRKHGVECGATDVLICAVAAREQFEILTSDKGLIRCIETLRAEGLRH